MASIHKGAGAIEHPVITPLAAPGTSTLAGRPAPAPPRIGDSAGTAIAHKRTSLNRRALLPGTDPLSTSTALNGVSHTLQEAGSSIAVQYADGHDDATGFKVDGKAILGHAVKPNIAAL